VLPGMHRDRAHTREELAVLLWPDASATLARKYLRQALWQLQSALTAELLRLGAGWVLSTRTPTGGWTSTPSSGPGRGPATWRAPD
jgi:hypothetical protein